MLLLIFCHQGLKLATVRLMAQNEGAMELTSTTYRSKVKNATIELFLCLTKHNAMKTY